MHAGLAACDPAPREQPICGRPKWLAIIGGIDGAQGSPVRQDQPSGPLYLQKENIRRVRIGQRADTLPCDFRPDWIFAPRAVRQCLIDLPRRGNQIIRPTWHRFGKGRDWRQTRLIGRLEITGEARLAIRCNNLDRREQGLQDRPRALRIADYIQSGAGGLPFAILSGPRRALRHELLRCTAGEDRTRSPHRRQARRQISASPARQAVISHRLRWCLPKAGVDRIRLGLNHRPRFVTLPGIRTGR